MLNFNKLKEITGGNTDIAEHLLSMFFEEISQQNVLDLIERCRSGVDSAVLLNDLHKLIGSCNYCGAELLAAILKSLYLDVKNKEHKLLNDFLQKFEAECINILSLKANIKEIIFNAFE